MASFQLTTVNWLVGRWQDDEPPVPRLRPVVDVLLEGCASRGGSRAS